jgi:hypothetical protein
MNAAAKNSHPATLRARGLRSGSALPYVVVAMIGLIGVASIGVDWGHVEMVKTDMQRCADATARGSVELYLQYGQSTAQISGAQLYSAAENPVDSNSGVAPKVTVQWGTWDTTSRTFSTAWGTGTGTPAVKVTVARNTANGNPIPLTWGAVFGHGFCDAQVSAVAAVMGGQSAPFTTPGTSDPYLAGMPPGSTASYDDNTSNAPPYQITSIPVIPGSYITLSNITGQVRHDPKLAYDGPDGNAGFILDHGSDSPGGPTPSAENGIADAVMPIDALLGVFLDNNAPNTTAAPATRDYTTAASRNEAQYNDIDLKQPFYIGNGTTTSGVTQQFLVPANATRLFLSTWDGHEWMNNGGSFSGTITAAKSVEIVQ